MQLIATSDSEGQRIAVAESRLDAAVAIEFKDAMRRAMQGGAGPVTLDLSQVRFMDSSGLGAVIAVLKMMPQGRALRLSGLTPNVARVFHLTRMDSVFTILDQPPRAAAAGKA